MTWASLGYLDAAHQLTPSLSLMPAVQTATARPCSQNSILLPVGARIDELIEATDVSVVGVLLIEELKAALVEHAEEFVP
jgi:hypothetical protein